MGIDLPAELGTPRLTFRRLRLLLERAPWGSEYSRARLGDRVDWSARDHLLATIVDQLAVYDWNRRAERAKDARKHAPPRPAAIIRPGMSTEGQSHRTTLSPRQIARRLVDQRRRAAAPRT